MIRLNKILKTLAKTIDQLEQLTATNSLEVSRDTEQIALENKEVAPKAVVFDNCMALLQESWATFLRTLEDVNTMTTKGNLAVPVQHRWNQQSRYTLLIEKPVAKA